VTTILWVGAHKTGTTFLQRCLDRSGDALRRGGVNYMTLDDFRRLYTRPLLDRDSEEAPGDPNDLLRSAASTNLVFDENIPALVQHAVSRTGFYPDAVERLTRVLGHLGLSVDRVIVGVRSYDSFVPSMYIETLKSTPFKTFDRYLAHSLAPADPRVADVTPSANPRLGLYRRLNWYKYIRRLADAFAPADVDVYFHEDLRGRERELLAAVLGLPGEQFSLLEGEERRGFSGRAVAELHRRAAEGDVGRSDVRELTSKYPSGPENPTFYPWSDSEADALRDLYRTHSVEIGRDARLRTIDLG
jgi:hypothetical protein